MAATRIAIGAPPRSATTGPWTLRRTVSGTSFIAPSASRTLMVSVCVSNGFTWPSST